MLRKNIGLTVVIVASLAIGIGANSAIFSVVDALLLRPLPYPQPERLAAVWLHSPGIGILRDWPSPGQYIDIQNENHSFEQMALAQSRTFTLTGREQPERIDGMRGAIQPAAHARRKAAARPPAAAGRGQARQTGGGHSQRASSGSACSTPIPQIVGKSITLNGNPFTVAGVLRRGFMLNAEVMPSEGPDGQGGRLSAAAVGTPMR